MASHIVSYDLHRQGQNYDCLIAALKTYPLRWHLQMSVWIIVSDRKSVEIRNHLQPCLDANDKLFVGRLTGEAAWYGHSDASDWLKQNL